MVTVKSLVKNYEIHVKQLGYGPALLVKSSVSTLEAEGGGGNCYSHFQHRKIICGGKSAESDLVTEASGSASYPYLVSKIILIMPPPIPCTEARTVTLTFTAYKDSLLQEPDLDTKRQSHRM